MILCDGPTILEAPLGVIGRDRRASGTFPTLEEVERQHIMRALTETGGVLAGPQGAAKLLGMRRSTVWSRMKKLGIQPIHEESAHASGRDAQARADIAVRLVIFRHHRRQQPAGKATSYIVPIS